MLHSGMSPASSCIEFLSLHCVTLLKYFSPILLICLTVMYRM
uniref:Uncharacterized protein n=1 Tax=Anguilla anguilla TaxID=7936 RepID=A0A0E9S1H1_ANGAN